MANEKDVDVEVTAVNGDTGEEQKLVLPEALKKAVTSLLEERDVKRKQIIAQVEKDYGSKARLAFCAMVELLAYHMHAQRMIHQSNIPLALENQMKNREDHAETEIGQALFDSILEPQFAISDEWRGNAKSALESGKVSEWPQTVLMKLALQMATDDIAAATKAGESVTQIVRALASKARQSQGDANEKPRLH